MIFIVHTIFFLLSVLEWESTQLVFQCLDSVVISLRCAVKFLWESSLLPSVESWHLGLWNLEVVVNLAIYLYEWSTIHQEDPTSVFCTFLSSDQWSNGCSLVILVHYVQIWMLFSWKQWWTKFVEGENQSKIFVCSPLWRNLHSKDLVHRGTCLDLWVSVC